MLSAYFFPQQIGENESIDCVRLVASFLLDAVELPMVVIITGLLVQLGGVWKFLGMPFFFGLIRCYL